LQRTIKRRQSRSYTAGEIIGNVCVVLILVIWHFASLKLPAFVLPPPVAVFTTVFQLFFDWNLAPHTYISLLRVVGSLILSLIIGGGIVLIGHYVPLARSTVADKIIPFLNSFPSLGWAMIALMWLGVSNVSVIFVETAIILPFCMVNMWEGIKNVDPELLEMGHSFSRSRIFIIRKIVLPMMYPYIFSAAQISYGVAWKVALISELFGAQAGLGYLLNLARQEFDISLMFAVVIAIIIIVTVSDNVVFRKISARIFAYRNEETI
jgi:NitT/TauT family transport system permease protein/sulfonate transport system permease protein